MDSSGHLCITSLLSSPAFIDARLHDTSEFRDCSHHCHLSQFWSLSYDGPAELQDRKPTQAEMHSQEVKHFFLPVPTPQGASTSALPAVLLAFHHCQPTRVRQNLFQGPHARLSHPRRQRRRLEDPQRRHHHTPAALRRPILPIRRGIERSAPRGQSRRSAGSGNRRHVSSARRQLASAERIAQHGRGRPGQASDPAPHLLHSARHECQLRAIHIAL